MNLWIFVIGYGTIQSLLLIYLLSITKNKNNKGIYYLSFLLFVTTYMGILHLLSNYGFREIYPNLFILGFSPMFLIPPLYYLFCASNLNTKNFSAITILHFFPFVFFLTIQFVNVKYKSLIFLAFVVQLFLYGVLNYRLIFKREKDDIKPTKPLKFLTICILFFSVCVTLLYISTIIFKIKSISLTSIIVLFFIVFVTILEVHIIKDLRDSFNFTVFANKKYKNSNLQSQDINDLEVRLNKLLVDEKIFLKTNLKANDIAERLKITRHQLTEFINQELDCTFNDLVNKHRIDFAKEALLDKNMNHLSISGLANEAGFKSVATFYRVFKKHTGLTPSEYININTF